MTFDIFLSSYSNVFFVHFRSFVVLVHGPERITVHPPLMKSLRPSFVCSLDLPQYQKSIPSNKSRMNYLF